MRNLTDEILLSKKYLKDWSREKLEQIVKSWKLEDNALIFDNDPGSGELWVRVIKNNEVLCLLGVSLPLLIMSEKCEKFNLDDDLVKLVHVVSDTDFNEKSWEINLKIIEAFVPEINWHASLDAVNTKYFSMNDFWYATV